MCNSRPTFVGLGEIASKEKHRTGTAWLNFPKAIRYHLEWRKNELLQFS